MLAYTGGENKSVACRLQNPDPDEDECKLLHELDDEDEKELVYEGELQSVHSLETELAILQLAETNTKLLCDESLVELETLQRLSTKARNPKEVESLYKRCRQWR